MQCFLLSALLVAVPHARAAAGLLAQVASLPQDRADTEGLLARGDLRGAEWQLRSELAANEASPRRFLLAYVLMREGKAEASLEQYTLAARVRRPSAEDLKNVALDYVLLKSYGDASVWIGRALGEKPDDPELWYVQGRVDYERLRFQQAVGSFERALALAPKSAKIENNLGLAYEGLNRVEDAMRAYEAAIRLQPLSGAGSEQPYINLAVLQGHRGEPRAAVALLEQAARIAPGDARVHEELGKAYDAAGELARAQEELEAAVLLSPEDGALHFLLGRVYRRNHLPEKAAAEFERSAALKAVGNGASKPQP